MQPDLVQIATGFGSPPVIGYTLSRILPHARARFYFLWSTSALGGMLGSWLPPSAPVQSASNGASLLLAAFCWWLSRRRRKRAPKAMGAKSRALIAAMVAKVRESAKPRPVLKPVPGGSGA